MATPENDRPAASASTAPAASSLTASAAPDPSDLLTPAQRCRAWAEGDRRFREYLRVRAAADRVGYRL